MRNMPMTRRQLKKEFKLIEKREQKLARCVDTKQWLGVAYAHIATPKASFLCMMRYSLSRLLSGRALGAR